MSEQLSLHATPGMLTGNAYVTQCANCGLLAYVPTLAPKKLHACPACDGTTWSKQQTPVGPFE